MRKHILILMASFVLVCLISCKQKKPKETYLIMVSIDGCRWDYPDRTYTPTLDSIEQYGVKAASIKPSFPTKTFPNHYSMATGLYPDHHGIVQNLFYDPELDMEYAIYDRDAVENPIFYGGEPIWVTAEKQGVKSASFFWVGSETPIQDMQPSYWEKYNQDFPFEERVDAVVNWLKLPDSARPHFILLYFHEPDGTGHEFGPDSREINNNVTYLDSLLGDLSTKINKLPIADEINLIVTSDHGMGPVDSSQQVYIDHYADTNWFTHIIGHNPNYILGAKDEYYDSAYTALKTIPHVSVWKSEEVPEYLNYGSNARTLDFVLVADSAWAVALSDNPINYKGAHGYDNTNKDMHAIFYAIGPEFKNGYQGNTFENVDLYPLICKIFNLEGAEVDGEIERAEAILKGLHP